VPEEALAPYLCETLGLQVSELARWDWNEVVVHVAWAEGRSLAGWMQQHVNG
jgi:hypothetical protein